jgi:hypothetical protein
MAYYKVRIEVWCDRNPAESDLEEIAENIGARDAICTMQEVAVVDRPQDIDNDEAMSFFGGEEGDADQSQGVAASHRQAASWAARSQSSRSWPSSRPRAS